MRNNLNKLIICFICSIFSAGTFYPVPAWSAFKSVHDGVDIVTMFNPKTEKDDIALPMPCDMKLILKGVEVPSNALIRDRAFSMGITNLHNSERQIYDRQFPGYISAPFTVDDIPAEWTQKLSSTRQNSKSDTWYFIGKYEITEAQWKAVMFAVNKQGEEDPNHCPVYSQKNMNLPVTGISWFDAQEFLNRYNAWLIKNHASSLPHFKGTQNIGFLRLPTEEEWEYAAKGGSKVPPEWWEDKDFFPIEQNKLIDDYGVFTRTSPYTQPMAIGSRNPNPLGIYDTAGNVSEMVDGFFRMSIADMKDGKVERRRHGAAGGILTKGGSFRDNEEGIMPGARDEVPLYTAKGPGRSNELGIRLVLSGLNIPNAERLDALRNETQAAKVNPTPAVTSQNFNENVTPVEMIEALSKTAPADLKQPLQKIKTKLDDQNIAQAALNNKKLENNYRALLYQSETIRAFAFRYLAANKEMKKIEALLEQPLSASQKSEAQKILAEAKKDLNDYLKSLEMGASYYKTTMGVILNEPANELTRLATQAKQEYGGSGIFNEHMRQNIDILQKNIKYAKQNGLNSLSSNDILKGILPENHLKLLPFYNG